MEELRDRTGETVMLVAIDHARLMVQRVVESRHALRSIARSDPNSRSRAALPLARSPRTSRPTSSPRSGGLTRLSTPTRRSPPCAGQAGR
jgi:hypothetical protein